MIFKQIIKFKDGRYALRRLTLFGYEYKDLRQNGYWWGQNTEYYNKDCKGTFDQVLTCYDSGKRVSRKEISQQRLISALKGNG